MFALDDAPWRIPYVGLNGFARVEMTVDHSQGISSWVARLGGLLALTLVVTLLLGPTSAHAHSGDNAGVVHHGPLCPDLEANDEFPDGNGNRHSDCAHHADPMVQFSVESQSAPRLVLTTLGEEAPARQANKTVDPPPPRSVT